MGRAERDMFYVFNFIHLHLTNGAPDPAWIAIQPVDQQSVLREGDDACNEEAARLLRLQELE